MIWQREVALPLRSDWLTAGKAVNTGLAKKIKISPKTEKKKRALRFSSPLSLQAHFKVVMFVR